MTSATGPVAHMGTGQPQRMQPAAKRNRE